MVFGFESLIRHLIIISYIHSGIMNKLDCLLYTILFLKPTISETIGQYGILSPISQSKYKIFAALKKKELGACPVISFS